MTDHDESTVPAAASTSTSMHLLFDSTRTPTIRVVRQPDDPNKLHLILEVDDNRWPTHHASVTLTAPPADLDALLDQARAAIREVG